MISTIIFNIGLIKQSLDIPRVVAIINKITSCCGLQRASKNKKDVTLVTPVELANLTSIINGLTILTSVSVVIATYLDTRHKEKINSTVNEVKNYNFDGLPNNSFVENARKLYDEIRRMRPLSNYKCVVAFMILLPFFGVDHFLCLRLTHSENFHFWITILIEVEVFAYMIMLLWMFEHLYTMYLQRKILGERHTIFNIMAEACASIDGKKIKQNVFLKFLKKTEKNQKTVISVELKHNIRSPLLKTPS